MSNIQMIIEERAHEVGNFLVGRLLPFRNKRMVGPFIFLDHMGPAHLPAGIGFDVPPHPHIGLSTLTYLLEGSIMHRDSLGTEIEIHPGAVNWMTAGKGIVHSERSPDHARPVESVLHGLQIWVALPKELEQCEPSFSHTAEGELPTWQEHGLQMKLVAGTYGDKTSPVPVHSPLFLIEIHAPETTTVAIGDKLFGEAALYVLHGSVEIEGQQFGEKQILVAASASLCTFTVYAGSTIYIFGGEPFAEERYIYWNFVATSREAIEQAKQRWQDGAFPKVPGEEETVPLPPQRLS